jgi:hypothetical protein
MGLETVCTAMCKCTMGSSPSVLIVLPIHRTFGCCLPAANITDHIPFLNVLPFGVCSSILCPTTAALTAAALGALTPGPCIPMTLPPWSPGSPTVLIDGKPALNNSSKVQCIFGGSVSIAMPAQFTVLVP